MLWRPPVTGGESELRIPLAALPKVLTPAYESLKILQTRSETFTHALTRRPGKPDNRVSDHLSGRLQT